jgi:hypothetical protein
LIRAGRQEVPRPGPSAASTRATASPTITNPFFLANPRQKSFNGARKSKTRQKARDRPAHAPQRRADGRPGRAEPEIPVRLSKHKIQYLGGRILKMMQDHPQIHPDHNVDLVTRAVEDALAENMELEDEIDAEVEALLNQNKAEINAMEMDVGALRMKMKRELARKRGFTL